MLTVLTAAPANVAAKALRSRTGAIPSRSSCQATALAANESKLAAPASPSIAQFAPRIVSQVSCQGKREANRAPNPSTTTPRIHTHHRRIIASTPSPRKRFTPVPKDGGEDVDFARRRSGFRRLSVPLAGAAGSICPARYLIKVSVPELRELAGLFLKLGTLGFGGPAAHIALMQEEVVRRRGWMSQSEFLDTV